jgi:hypothetical protein
MVAVAIIGAAVVGGAATVASSHSASSTAAKNADKNNALQTDIYNQNKAALAPYQDGGRATGAINSLLGLNPDKGQSEAALKNYYDSTGYTSRLKQGQDSVTAALGSRGMLESGSAQKSLLKYGQDFASNEFGKYLGYLSNQQQVGLTAASAQAGVGQGYANSVSQNNNNASNVASNAALATGGAINNTISGALSAYGLSQGMQSSYGKGASSADSVAGYGGLSGVY